MPILFILFGIVLYIYFELSLLVSVGSAIGVFPMILLLITISFVGLWLVKLRGAYTFYRIRQDLASGKLPTEAVISSILFMFAGVLLIIPGFLSDILAILCVLPISRQFIQAMLVKFFKNRVNFSAFSQGGYTPNKQGNGDDTIFEAEFERQQDQDKWIK